jgi:predicted flap endonuclease-1-like 5' DNA nuclease
MAAKTLQSLLGKHAEIISEFKEQLAKAQSSKPVTGVAAVRGKERLLQSLDTRLATEKSARKATVARLDRRIAVLEKRSESLRAEIEADRKALEPRGKGSKPPRFPGIGKPRPGRGPAQGPKKPGVTAIKGVGDAYRERLETAGVHTVARVAKMKPAALAEALSVSEARAKAIIAAAKKVKPAKKAKK